MTQLVAFDDEKNVMFGNSDSSNSENDEAQASKKQTNKSLYTDKIAKNLVNSHDKVDQRMLKLHKIVENSQEKTDLINYLGVKDSLSKSLFKGLSKSKVDQGQKA